MTVSRRTFLQSASSAAAAAVLPGLLRAAPAGKRPPNIVMIISDDHGWTDYGFMGHPTVKTPRLDKLATESLVFRRGYVPSPLCCPSLASMITGLYPHQHKVTCNDPPGSDAPRGKGPKAGTPEAKKAAEERKKAFAEGREVMSRHIESVDTLPRLLGKLGYASLQTGKWWQGHFSRGGFTHGMTQGQRHGDQGLDIGRKTMKPILDFIDQAQKDDKPFFVWYAPMMPHDPHTPPADLLAKYQAKTDSIHQARYWAMVDWFDQTCGAILDHLDKTKLAEDTIVLYVADNGWTQDPNSRGPVRSKLTPYDAGLRTPIMVRWPGKVAPKMSDELAMSIDLAPTILSAVGQNPSAAMPGVNLLDEKAVAARKRVCGESYVHTAFDLHNPSKNLVTRWIVEGKWKLIVPTALAMDRGPVAPKQPELYDIVADPKETQDLAAEKPEVVKDLTAKLDAWWKP